MSGGPGSRIGALRRSLHALVAAFALGACDAEPSPPTLVNREEVTHALVEAYPVDLRDRGVGGSVVVTGTVGRDGHFELSQVELVGATDPRFEAAARRVAPSLRFEPARVGPIPVEMRVAMPLSFEAIDPPAIPGA